ncbi:leucine-rich repeat-containing protein 26 [Pelodiscus sinensis]|uniref:leucine-rich repeat-containing protein 26 n=1 Tax=Pelodiscus sinensis TaxID=13735 RepID=UPI003F6B6C15
MAGGRGPATFLAFLLCLPRCPGCPAACSCSGGEVDCSHRALRAVPGDLPANASALWLSNNRIALLRAHAFPAQPALLNLSLRSNLLLSLHSRALAGLGALRALDLSHNYLSVLAPGTLLPFPGLVSLNVAANRLGQLPPEVPSALPRLQELSLHSNALRGLPAGVLRGLPALRALTLHGNPWACTCDIQPLLLWLLGHRDTLRDENLVVCSFPAHLDQFPLLAIGNESFSRCQAGALQPRDYVFFLLVGPASFLASVLLCLLAGSLAVLADHRQRQRRSW